jgi:Holliday junction resolvase RusA-like endonuclease
MIEIILQGDPTPKARARVFKRSNGKMGSFTPKKSKSYSDALAWAAKAAMKGKPPLEGALWARVQVYMPIPKSDKKARAGQAHIKKPDLDNIIKQLDALNGIVYKDDSQLCFISAWKMYSIEPRLEITIQKHEGLLTMTARDFIQNQLLPLIESGATLEDVSNYIIMHHEHWNDTGVVDVEAMDAAAALYDEPTSLFEFVQAYEQAKLKGKTEDASSLAKVRGSHDGAFSGAGVYQPMPTKLSKAWEEFKKVNDVRLREIEKASQKLDKITANPLPALPEKFQFETKYSLAMNAIIDCLAAVYEEINKGKTI